MSKDIKKAQVTIFIIIALLLVLGIIFVFALKNKAILTNRVSITDDPKAYIQKCASDAAEEYFYNYRKTSNLANPGDKIMYDNKKILLACYTSEYDELCVNKHPMLREEIEKSIENYALPKIEGCFAKIKENYKNYDYKEGKLNFSIEIIEKQIKINLEKDITITRNEQILNIKNFNTRINEPTSEFLRIENEIINQEVMCDCKIESCNADIYGLNLIEKGEFQIDKPTYSGKGEEVYVITEIISGKKFEFAIRNCVREPIT